MAETVKLDPAAVATDRTELEITKWVGKEGPDWGDAAVARQLAQTPYGDLPVGDPRWPNRQIQIPLGALRDLSTHTFEQARTQLQQKIGLFQSEGGWVMRETAIGAVYAEVVGATLKLGGSDAQIFHDIDPDASLVLDALPHWLEDEVEHGPFNANGILEFTLSDLRGSVPGPIRIVVENGETVRWQSLLYALQSRHYSVGAPLSYEVESLTPLEGATVQADALAYGGSCIEKFFVPERWVGIAESAALSHEGTFELWARVRDLTSTNVDTVQVAAEWGLGSLVKPTRTPPRTIPVNARDYTWVYLGEMQIEKLLGGQRAFIRPITRAAASGAVSTVRIDKLLVVPVNEAAGVVRCRAEPRDPSTFVAYDDFAGYTTLSLAGQTAEKGGSWAYVAGDTTDFEVLSTDSRGRARRTSVSDTAPRIMRLGTGVAALSGLQWEFTVSALPTTSSTQYLNRLYLRWVDANNNLALVYTQLADQGFATLALRQTLAGVVTSAETFIAPLIAGAHYKAKMWVEADGRAFARLRGPGADQPLELASAALATGGALDDGGYCLADFWDGATACTRDYFGFEVFTPELDAVAYPGRSVEISDRGAFREEPGGTHWTPALVDGEYPTAAPAGMEGREQRVLLVPSRGRMDETTDPTMDDDIEATAYTRAAHLFVPEPT